MTTNNMHNLTTLIKRLEAATARLEDIATSTIELPTAASTPAPSSNATPPPPPASAVAAVARAPQPAAPAAAAAAAPASDPLPESIEDFDAFLSGAVAKYVGLSKKHGGLVAEQAATVLRGFEAQRTFLLIASKAKKPDLTGSEMSVYQSLLKPINDALLAVTEIKDANRASPDFNQLSTVSEGIIVLAWVTIDSRPNKYVEEALGSAQFFGNRVLKEFKDKDPQQVEWVQAFYGVFRELVDYVKQYFGNGIPWNAKGKPALEVAKEVAASAAGGPPPPPPPPGGAGGPPPPPPPPPPGPAPVLKIKEEAPAPTKGSAGAAHSAVFSELNKGEAVTKGLRKVDKSEMTHKNPALRAGSTVPAGDAHATVAAGGRGKSPVPSKKPKPESMRVKKPAKKALDENMWTIENFDKESASAPIEIEATINQSIMISKCSNTTVIVRGKANAVTVENTSRLSLVLESLVSSVDVVKSQNFALQVLGQIPTVMLDQVDGAQVYLSKASTASKVFMSKTDGVNLNVLVPVEGGADDDDEGEYKEVPLPSQIASYYDPAKGELVSEIVSHAG